MAPLRAKRQRDSAVYQQRLDVGKLPPQLIQDSEAVRIDINSVIQRAFAQPIRLRQRFETIPAANNNQTVRACRKRQKIDFNFGDEHPFCRCLQRHETVGIQRKALLRQR